MCVLCACLKVGGCAHLCIDVCEGRVKTMSGYLFVLNIFGRPNSDF